MDQIPLPDKSDLIGTRIDGRYRLQREAGRGCFGVVYEAVDERFDSPVALKLFLPGRSGSSTSTFRREAMLARRFRHPNVVEVYDYGVDEAKDYYYVVMEYLHGRSLEDAFNSQGRTLAVEELIRFIEQICSALDVAHTRNLVHRDLKPSNIMVVEEGHLLRFVILDLGIASKLDASQTLRNMTMDKAMTPAYASPEQINGREVGPKSDIYSFATMVYELFTGRIPFSTDFFYALARDICERQPPSLMDQQCHVTVNGTPLCLPPEILSEIEQVLFACLEKKPEKRPDSIHEVGERLVNALNQLIHNGGSGSFVLPPNENTVVPPIPEPTRPRRWAVPALVLLFGLLAAAIGYLSYLPNTPGGWLPADRQFVGVGEPVEFSGNWFYPELLLPIDGRDDLKFILIAQGEPFYIMENEVDNDLYRRFAEQASVSDDWKRGALVGNADLGVDGAQAMLPVVNIKPQEAYQFARWLAGEHGHLPSVYEWLDAAGCKGRSEGPFQGDWRAAKEAGEIAIDCADTGPAPVGTSQADISIFGVRDMAGNVREWTRTLDRGSVEIPHDRPGDYVNFLSKSYQEDSPYECDSEHRRTFHDASDPITGFRVVLLPRRTSSE